MQMDKKMIEGETHEIYETVFNKHIDKEEKSPLFDATRWLNVRPPPRRELEVFPLPQPPPLLADPPKQPPQEINKQNEPVAQVTSISPVQQPERTRVALLPPMQPEPAPLKTKPFKSTSPKTKTKWIPDQPLTLLLKLEYGTDIPTRAGTLGLDHIAQPFSSDPYVEFTVSSIESSLNELDLDDITNAPPISSAMRFDSPICDSQMKWNYTHTAVFPPMDIITSTDLDRFILIGKLYDYRRIASAKLMGVFAIKLSAIEIGSSLNKGVPKLISLTSVDPFTFDVSKARIKMTLVLQGKLVNINDEEVEIISVESEDENAIETSEEALPTESAPIPVSNDPEVHADIEPKPRLSIHVSPQPAHETEKIVYSSPFKRALDEARMKIRQGDFSPLYKQNHFSA
jgi:hypothetical protein